MDLTQQVLITPLSAARRLAEVLVVRRRGDLQPVLGEHPADRLDTPAQPTVLAVVGVLADEVHDHREGRSSSAPKKAAAAFKMALARFSSAFSRFSRRTSADSSVVVPGRAPASTSA